MAEEAGLRVPKQVQPVYDAIVALTDRFCQERLTDEYAVLCRKLAASLSRKRPSPLLTGHVETWAAGIAYTIAKLNFLFDQSNDLYISAADVAAAFGVAASTATGKCSAIRQALHIANFDWHWSIPSKMTGYPGAWLITVDGLMVDARSMPRDIQEEAFRRGYIPGLPPSS